jgi:hypothetical protein
MEAYLNKVVSEGQGRKIIEFFEQVIRDSYGVRSFDGSTFEKSEEIFRRFQASGAYDALIEKVLDDPDYALVFIRGIVPGKYKEALDKKLAEETPNGFRPAAQTLPQSRVDQLKAAEAAEAASLLEDTQPMTPPVEEFGGTPSAPIELAVADIAPTEGPLPTDPLLPHEPGYAQGLTRQQAIELNLL